MKEKIFAFSLVSLFTCCSAFAEVLDLDTALQNTYHACVDIDNNLHELKVLAGVNTGVTGVGTGLGIGAVATGLAKSSIDAEIENLLAQMRTLSNEYQGDDPSQEAKAKWRQKVDAALDNVDWDAGLTPEEKRENEEYLSQLEQKREKLEQKSKNLGNWRTGLLAGNTVNYSALKGSPKTAWMASVTGITFWIISPQHP